MRNEALSEREEAARRATEEAQGVRKEIERCLVFGVCVYVHHHVVVFELLIFS